MLFMVPVVQQKVEMVSPHTQLDAVIDNDSLNGNIKLPVTFQQSISSDNPYVDIKYSEYIQIDKK